MSLAPGADPVLQSLPEAQRQVFARLVTHYWSNGCFLDDSPVLDNMERLASIPAVLIHGCLDVSSPLDTAWDLHRSWPASRLEVLDDAGHGGGSMLDHVVASVNDHLYTAGATSRPEA